MSYEFVPYLDLPRTTHTSYLYLPDGKVATIRLTRMALEPADPRALEGERRRVR